MELNLQKIEFRKYLPILELDKKTRYQLVNT